MQSMDPEDVGYEDTWAALSTGLTERGTASCKRGVMRRLDMKEKTIILVSRQLMLTRQGKLVRVIRQPVEPSIPSC